MRAVLGLFLVGLASSNFYMGVGKEEKCLVDNFVKNQEAIIKMEIANFDQNPTFDFYVIIKDIGIGFKEVQRFSFKNEAKRSFIYTHLTTGEAAVCLMASTELFVNVKLDVNVALPDNLIDKNDMAELESTIYQTVTSMADFTRGQKDLGSSGKNSLSENIELNSRLVRLTIIEGVVIAALSLVQYVLLRRYVPTKLR